MTTLDQATAGARRHAKSAALRDVGLQACPYPSDGTAVESACRRVWIRTYRHARPTADVDYADDVDALADDQDDDVDLAEADTLQVPNVLMTLQEAMGPDGARLKRYWTKGKGAARINWGVDGDFDRCVTALAEHVDDPKGLCSVYHKAATGDWPGKGKGH